MAQSKESTKGKVTILNQPTRIYIKRLLKSGSIQSDYLDGNLQEVGQMVDGLEGKILQLTIINQEPRKPESE